MKKTIREFCTECEGTGIVRHPWAFRTNLSDSEKYVGFVCPCCKGTGCIEHSYEPFTARKEKAGINVVFSYPGSEQSVEVAKGPERFISRSITYHAFAEGKQPPNFYTEEEITKYKKDFDNFFNGKTNVPPQILSKEEGKKKKGLFPRLKLK